MLPICLVTGFLGTGKTTLLKNIVAKNRDRKIVYLINEFSVHDVDGAIVMAENPDVVSIPGGSIFCKCLVTEFIGQLKKIVAMDGGLPVQSDPGGEIKSSRCEGVVIEASGMANPKIIEEMLVETKLNEHFRLATIISVLDANSFLKLRHTLPNIIAQVESADVVLINKTDCNSAKKNEEARAAVRDLNPSADCIQTVRCCLELDLFSEKAPRGLQGEYAACRDPNYATFVTEEPFNGDLLERFVAEHAEDIYRIKGTLTDEFFDYSTTGAVRTPQPGAASALAWIVRGDVSEKIKAGLQSL